MSKRQLPETFLLWKLDKKKAPPRAPSANPPSTATKPEPKMEVTTPEGIPSPPPPQSLPPNPGMRKYPMGGVSVEFPFQPYPAQIQMMAKIVQALKTKQNALLESPTGSGKSLAILCAALAWREHEKKRMAEELEKLQKEVATTLELEQKLEEERAFAAAAVEAATEAVGGNVVPVKREIEDDDDDDFRPLKLPPKLRASTPHKAPVEIKLEDTKEPSATQEAAKSDSKLRPAIRVPTIYVGSRTHKQLSQLVGELKGNTSYRPKMSVLGSREQYCIHPKVSKANDKSEECTKLLDLGACTYATRVKQMLGHPSLQRGGVLEIWDIEDLNLLGKHIQGCPYYTSRSLAEVADIVFCPYNYLLDPLVRESLDIKIEDNIIILDEAHNIEDAARAAGSFETTEKELQIIQIELKQIIRSGYLVEEHDKILFLVQKVLEWITDPGNEFDRRVSFEEEVRIWSGTQILEKLDDIAVRKSTFNETLQSALKKVAEHTEATRKSQEKKKAAAKAGKEQIENMENDAENQDGQTKGRIRECLSTLSLRVLEGLFMIFKFLFEDGRNIAEDYRMALIKRAQRGPRFSKESSWTFKLGFWCLNPGVIFREIAEKAHSVVLTSGTLSPLNTFASELEAEFPIRLEANHVIDRSRVWISSITTGPGSVDFYGTWDKIAKFEYQDAVGHAICNISESIPYGILCFVPSYQVLEKLTDRWKKTGVYERLQSRKHVICEPPGSGNKALFEALLKQYYDHISSAQGRSATMGNSNTKDGAIFFAVYRGKVSEGIDFTDNNCRAVIALGIPFPNVKDIQVELKRGYNDYRRKKGDRVLEGSEWYKTQAYRAINQALGRCIRHKKDWGAVILLEARFSQRTHVNQLSKWVRSMCTSYTDYNTAMSDLQSFASERLADERQQFLEYEAAAAAAAMEDIESIESDPTTPMVW